MGAFDFSSHILGIDLGSFNLRIAKDDKIIFNERSTIGRDSETGRLMIFGNKVYELDQETFTNHNTIISNPINYTLSDFEGGEILFREALKKSLKQKSWFPKSIIAFTSIPINSSQVEIRAYRDSLEHMNVKKIHLIYNAVAISIGLKILFEKKDFIVIDFSASKIEVTVFSNSKPVENRIIRFGCVKLQRALGNYINRKYKVNPSKDQLFRMFKNYRFGINDKLFKIHNITITSQEVKKILEHYFIIIDDLLLECLESLDTTSYSKVLSNGIFFSGGGSYLDQICKRIAQPIRAPYSVSKNPDLDVINGIREVIKCPEKFNSLLFS